MTPEALAYVRLMTGRSEITRLGDMTPIEVEATLNVIPRMVDHITAQANEIATLKKQIERKDVEVGRLTEEIRYPRMGLSGAQGG